MTSPRWLRGGCGHALCTHRMSAPACFSGAQDTDRQGRGPQWGLWVRKGPPAETGHHSPPIPGWAVLVTKYWLLGLGPELATTHT